MPWQKTIWDAAMKTEPVFYKIYAKQSRCFVNQQIKDALWRSSIWDVAIIKVSAFREILLNQEDGSIYLSRKAVKKQKSFCASILGNIFLGMTLLFGASCRFLFTGVPRDSKKKASPKGEALKSYFAAITSISQRAPLGRSFAATQERAGMLTKYSA